MNTPIITADEARIFIYDIGSNKSYMVKRTLQRLERLLRLRAHFPIAQKNSLISCIVTSPHTKDEKVLRWCINVLSLVCSNADTKAIDFIQCASSRDNIDPYTLISCITAIYRITGGRKSNIIQIPNTQNIDKNLLDLCRWQMSSDLPEKILDPSNRLNIEEADDTLLRTALVNLGSGPIDFCREF